MALSAELKALKARKFLRDKRDGSLYGYTELLAKRPEVEEIMGDEAYPEKFMTKAQKERTAQVDLATDEEVVEEAATPKKKGTGLKVSATGGKKK